MAEMPDASPAERPGEARGVDGGQHPRMPDRVRVPSRGPAVPADRQHGGEPQQADQAANQADTRVPERQLAVEAGQCDMRGNQR